MEPGTPNPQEVVAVETSLYNRMVKNALIGFVKTALIGGVLGLVLGGLAGAMGLVPASLVAAGSSPVVYGALQGALWLAGIVGSFGAIAGIQSTRDTRRWFLQHEDPSRSPEETREPAIIVQQAPKRQTLTLEVIDKNTPGYMDKIGKKELGMLIHMLEDSNHPRLESTARDYGYMGNDTWDEQVLAAYKSGRLQERFVRENYTFFLLRDAGGQVVALASGNAAEDKSQFRLLNLATERGEQRKGYGTALIQYISHYAAQNGFERVVTPLSEHAVQYGEAAFHQRVAEKLDLDTLLRRHPTDDASVEFVSAPKKFRSLEMSDNAVPAITGTRLGYGMNAY